MLFNVVLSSSLSFAFVARAIPLEFGSKSARRQISTQNVISANVHILSTDTTVISVAGSMIAPKFTGPEGDTIAFGMGLDTDPHFCNTGTFEIGFTATADPSQTSYQAMYRDPSHLNIWQNMSVKISTGDMLYMAVALDPENMSVGWAQMENVDGDEVQGVGLKTTGPSNPLCGQGAAWFVDIPSNELSNFDPINFGTATFVAAQANTTTKGMLYPGDSDSHFLIIPEVVIAAIGSDNSTISFVQRPLS